MDKIGPYVIEREIGSGGMGRVFLARHETLGRTVALKLMNRTVRDDSTMKRRFQREMQLVAKFEHPGLVKVYDGGVEGEHLYFAMEVIPGADLDSAVIRSGPLPPPLVLAIAQKLSLVLAFLHDKNVVHRDLKAGNVRLTPDGRVVLLDLGLASLMDPESTQLTAPGEVLGTLYYMAPELFLGEDPSPASDLWALGTTMYLMLTGQRLLAGVETGAWLEKLAHELIPDPRDLRKELPAEVSDLVMNLLEKDPGLRPRSGDVVSVHLGEALTTWYGTRADDLLVAGWTRAFDTFNQMSFREGAPLAPMPTLSGSAVRRRSGVALPGMLESDSAQPRPTVPPMTRDAATRVIPARTPPRSFNAGAIAMGLALMLAVAVGFGRLKGVGGTVQSIRALEVVQTAASPRPAPSGPLAPADLPWLSGGRWAAYVPRLVASDRSARVAMDELRRKSGLDLGTSPEAWMGWVEVGQLCSREPRRPPRSGPVMPEEMARAYLEIPQRNFRPPPLDLARVAYLVIHRWPRDGRAWLILGRALELEGFHGEARRLYDMGLSLLDQVTFAWQPLYLWTAVSRALLLRDGMKAVPAWLTLIDRTLEVERAWMGLREALIKSDPGTLEVFLEAGMNDPRSTETVSLMLTKIHGGRGGARAAREILERGLSLRKDSSVMRNELLKRAFELGDTDLAGRWIEGHSGQKSLAPLMPLLTAPFPPARGCEPGILGSSPDESVAALDAQLLIEEGCRTRALAVVRTVGPQALATSPSTAGVLFELLSTGENDDDVKEAARVALLEHARPAAIHDQDERALAWELATGSLGDAEGPLAGWIGDLRRAWPKHPLPDAVAALWHSRALRHERALDSLKALDQFADHDDIPGAWIVEVATAPMWWSWLGEPVDASTLARARALRLKPLVGGSLSGYHRALIDGNFAKAADIALSRFEGRPWEFTWTFGILAHAIRTGQAPSTMPMDQLRRAARFHGAGPWIARLTSHFQRSRSGH